VWLQLRFIQLQLWLQPRFSPVASVIAIENFPIASRVLTENFKKIQIIKMLPFLSLAFILPNMREKNVTCVFLKEN
jgi:hypothetical protein